MRALIKKLIPKAGREAIKEALQARALRKALIPLRVNGQVSRDEMIAIRSGWGNEGFSGDVRYLEETAKLLKSCRGAVLECGTGATTIIAGVLAEKYGFGVYCLEQDAEWSARVRRALKANRLTRVQVFDAPIIRYGDYVWHDMTGIKLPKHFGAIICDGPFVDTSWGEPIHPNWRYGVLPYIKQSGSKFDALLLDDVNDKRAPKVLSRWASEFGTTQDLIFASEGDCGLIRMT